MSLINIRRSDDGGCLFAPKSEILMGVGMMKVSALSKHV
jgi:hypothetical protein